MKKQSIECSASNSGSNGRGKPFVRLAYVVDTSRMLGRSHGQTMRRTTESMLQNGIIMQCAAANSGSAGRGKPFVVVVRRQTVSNA